MPEPFSAKLKKLEMIAENSPGIDKRFTIPKEEFVERRQKSWEAIKDQCDVGFAFSDDHYSGDVPYLGGNTNYGIEQVAFGLGPDPAVSGIIAGFEGVYSAGQLAPRAGVSVYATESLQLADEIYPVEGYSLKEILEKIAGKEVKRIGLLTPRQVVPEGRKAFFDGIKDVFRDKPEERFPSVIYKGGYGKHKALVKEKMRLFRSSGRAGAAAA